MAFGSLPNTLGGGGQASGAYLPGGGVITGSSGAITLTAGGTNQNITLTPSGTGIVSAQSLGVTGGTAGAVLNGIYQSTANALELASNGVRFLLGDSSQNATFAQRVRTADGTLALPGHAFTNDNASGMYRPATNTLGFSSGGVLSLTLDGYGAVVCGPAALGTTTTDGFFYLRAMAGAPTGVPTAYTGRVAATYDSTNNKLYIYNGAWKSVTLT